MASRKQREARLGARRAHRALAPYLKPLWAEEGHQAPQGPRMRLLPSRADRRQRREARKARNAQARAHAAAMEEARIREEQGETQVQAWRRQAHEGKDVVERAWRRTFKGIHSIGYRRNEFGQLEPGKSGLQMVGHRPESARIEPQRVMNPDQRLNPTRRRRHRHGVHVEAGRGGSSRGS
jgi:hypothetical protein